MLLFFLHSLQPKETRGLGQEQLFTVDACILFFDSRTMSVCDCPVAAASLKFLKQEGLSAAPNVKLPGYRGNELEGIFKDTVAQLLLQVIQVFYPVLLTFLPLGFFVQSIMFSGGMNLNLYFYCTALQQEISNFFFYRPQYLFHSYCVLIR